MLKMTSATLWLIAWRLVRPLGNGGRFLGKSPPFFFALWQLWPGVATATVPPGRQECLAGAQKQRRLCPDARRLLHF